MKVVSEFVNYKWIEGILAIHEALIEHGDSDHDVFSR